MVTAEEEADTALPAVTEEDAPAPVPGVGDEADGSGAERAAERLATGLGPGGGAGGGALGFGKLILEAALLVLGGGQGPVQAAVVVQQFVAGVEADQAAPGGADNVAADLDDVVLKLADPLAGLELGQALLEHVTDAVAVGRIPEVEDGVVADREGGPDGLQRPGGDLQGIAEGDPGRVGHDDVAEGVHAAATGAAGHLLELVGDQGAAAPAVPLAHPADDHGPGRHVDAEGEGVGREDDLHQAAPKENFDQLLEQGQQAGVVEADALPGEGRDGLDLLQLPVLGPQPGEVDRHHRLDPDELGRRDQMGTHHGQPLGVGLAVVAAEQEVDGREQVLCSEGVHDLPWLRLVQLRRLALGEAATVGAGVPPGLLAQLAAGAGEVPHQGTSVVHRLVELAVDKVVERKRNRPLLVGDEADGAVGAGDPGGDLIGVGDGGREADELDVLRAEDD